MKQTEYDQVRHISAVLSTRPPATCYHCGGVLKAERLGYSQIGNKLYCFSCFNEMCDAEEGYEDPASGAKMRGSVMLFAMIAGLVLVGWLAWRYL